MIGCEDPAVGISYKESLWQSTDVLIDPLLCRDASAVRKGAFSHSA